MKSYDDADRAPLADWWEPAGFFLSANQKHRASIAIAYPDPLQESPADDLYCAVATIDGRGRLSDRSALRVLGWAGGQGISIAVKDRVAVLKPSPDRRWTVRLNGYLVLPAKVRHACDLFTGDRVLIAAALTRSILVVYSTPVLASALWRYQSDLWT
ncbi:hypothetical protein [Nocardia yunnanensis]|uniref:hypothetical protein n=1 Tax=Nocardia yunnanensis TaxID=2382165 RepID=UPI0013C3FC57|nr:hypothetical protein [Nocardia yunnanensis]